MPKDQLRQILRAMVGNRAQEIREAYYKAIEGLTGCLGDLSPSFSPYG